MKLLRRAQHREWSGLEEALSIFWFGFLHMIVFFLGFEAFMVKLKVVSMVLDDKNEELHALITIGIFLNQMLGVVQLQVFLNDRLFHFIFGGVDNYINKSEAILRHVWEAGIQYKAWKACSGYRFRWLRFCCLMLSFGDTDFQRLVLEDRRLITLIP